MFRIVGLAVIPHAMSLLSLYIISLTNTTPSARSQGISSDSDPTGSYSGIESVLAELTQRRDEMAELWGTRKLRLDLSMRLRMFERNVMEVRHGDVGVGDAGRFYY